MRYREKETMCTQKNKMNDVYEVRGDVVWAEGASETLNNYVITQAGSVCLKDTYEPQMGR